MRNPDLIVVSAGHTEYKSSDTIEQLLRLAPSQIFDSIGLFSDEQILLLQQKHAVSVLGRGDLH